MCKWGSDPRKPDTDGDGLGDGMEVYTYFTSPTSTDTDQDGLSDGYEVGTLHTNASSPDTDNDGLWDGNFTHFTGPCQSYNSCPQSGYEKLSVGELINGTN